MTENNEMQNQENLEQAELQERLTIAYDYFLESCIKERIMSSDENEGSRLVESYAAVGKNADELRKYAVREFSRKLEELPDPDGQAAPNAGKNTRELTETEKMDERVLNWFLEVGVYRDSAEAREEEEQKEQERLAEEEKREAEARALEEKQMQEANAEREKALSAELEEAYRVLAATAVLETAAGSDEYPKKLIEDYRNISDFEDLREFVVGHFYERIEEMPVPENLGAPGSVGEDPDEAAVFEMDERVREWYVTSGFINGREKLQALDKYVDEKEREIAEEAENAEAAPSMESEAELKKAQERMLNEALEALHASEKKKLESEALEAEKAKKAEAEQARLDHAWKHYRDEFSGEKPRYEINETGNETVLEWYSEAVRNARIGHMKSLYPDSKDIDGMVADHVRIYPDDEAVFNSFYELHVKRPLADKKLAEENAEKTRLFEKKLRYLEANKNVTGEEMAALSDEDAELWFTSAVERARIAFVKSQNPAPDMLIPLINRNKKDVPDDLAAFDRYYVKYVQEPMEAEQRKEEQERLTEIRNARRHYAEEHDDLSAEALALVSDEQAVDWYRDEVYALRAAFVTNRFGIDTKVSGAVAGYVGRNKEMLPDDERAWEMFYPLYGKKAVRERLMAAEEAKTEELFAEIQKAAEEEAKKKALKENLKALEETFKPEENENAAPVMEADHGVALGDILDLENDEPAQEEEREAEEEIPGALLGVPVAITPMFDKEEPEAEEQKKEEPKQEAPKEEAPKKEEPKQEAPKKEEPKAETKKSELEIKQEEIAAALGFMTARPGQPVEAPEMEADHGVLLGDNPDSGNDEPAQEEEREAEEEIPGALLGVPVAITPKFDDEEPEAEAPKKEEPKQEAPQKEEPKQEAPQKEEPKAEVPKKEEPKAETKKSELEIKQEEIASALGIIAAQTIQPAEAPKKEEPKQEASEKEEPKKEELKQEAAEKETPKKEEPKKEEPKKEELKQEAAEKETPKKEEPKKTETGKKEAADDEFKARPRSKAVYQAGKAYAVVYAKALRELNNDMTQAESIFSWDSNQYKALKGHLDYYCSKDRNLDDYLLKDAFTKIEASVKDYREHADRHKKEGNLRRTTRLEICDSLMELIDKYRRNIMDPKAAAENAATNSMVSYLKGLPQYQNYSEAEIKAAFTETAAYKNTMSQNSIFKLGKIAENKEVAKLFADTILKNAAKAKKTEKSIAPADPHKDGLVK